MLWIKINCKTEVVFSVQDSWRRQNTNAGAAHFEPWKHAYGNWIREDSIHSERKILEPVKQALDSIPGSSEKVRGDRNRAPAVFETVTADSYQ